MKLRWSRQAQDDLDRIWLFHAEHSVDYADRVQARLNERAETLLKFPLLGRLNGNLGIRELPIPDIQYLIGYLPEPDEIRVVNIWSTREDRDR